MQLFLICDEELRAIGVRASTRHAQDSPSIELHPYTEEWANQGVMLTSTAHLETICKLIREILPENAFTPLPGVCGVASLHHEPLYTSARYSEAETIQRVLVLTHSTSTNLWNCVLS